MSWLPTAPTNRSTSVTLTEVTLTNSTPPEASSCPVELRWFWREGPCRGQFRWRIQRRDLCQPPYFGPAEGIRLQVRFPPISLPTSPISTVMKSSSTDSGRGGPRGCRLLPVISTSPVAHRFPSSGRAANSSVTSPGLKCRAASAGRQSGSGRSPIDPTNGNLLLVDDFHNESDQLVKSVVDEFSSTGKYIEQLTGPRPVNTSAS